MVLSFNKRLGRWRSEGAKEETYAAESVVRMVVLGPLNHVPPHNLGVAVLAGGFPVEVDFFKELLLVVFEFADHHGGSSAGMRGEGRKRELSWQLRNFVFARFSEQI